MPKTNYILTFAGEGLKTGRELAEKFSKAMGVVPNIECNERQQTVSVSYGSEIDRGTMEVLLQQLHPGKAIVYGPEMETKYPYRLVLAQPPENRLFVLTPQ